jgi:putative flippase GtrA
MLKMLMQRISNGPYKGPFRYLVIGGTSFALDLGLLIVFKRYLGIGVYIAATLSYVLALIYNFYLNRGWTFGARGGLQVHMALYALLVFINYFITLALLAWLGKLGIHYEVAKIISIMPILGWNYIAYKYIFTKQFSLRRKKNAVLAGSEVHSL